MYIDTICLFCKINQNILQISKKREGQQKKRRKTKELLNSVCTNLMKFYLKFTNLTNDEIACERTSRKRIIIKQITFKQIER